MQLELFSILLLSITPLTSATPVNGHRKSGLTSTDRTRILSLHNAARSQTGAKPLKWDSSIASAAQSHASQCNGMQHGGTSRNSKHYGQNLASLGTPNSPSSNTRREVKTGVDVKKMMEMWTNEKQQYDEDKAADGDLSSGHYTQVVWKDTKKVGCGVAVCGGGKEMLVVCEYYPRGNTNEIKGSFVEPKEAYKAMVGV